jgi:hypothetical protein
MLVCDLSLLNHAILAISGLSRVLGTLGQIMLSCLVHMHSHVRSLGQRQVHVSPIIWEVLPQSTSSSLQASRSQSSTQDIEIVVLRQQADYHQSVLRQQMEYRRQQAKYEKKDEYYSKLLAQNQALLSVS